MYLGYSCYGYWASITGLYEPGGYIYADGTIHDNCLDGGYFATIADRDRAVELYKKKSGKKTLSNNAERNVKQLALISGLHVEVRSATPKSGELYEFFTDSTKSHSLKTTHQYKNAKMFAEGVAMGRKLEKNLHT